jgi:hypothetical protein
LPSGGRSTGSSPVGGTFVPIFSIFVKLSTHNQKLFCPFFEPKLDSALLVKVIDDFLKQIVSQASAVFITTAFPKPTDLGYSVNAHGKLRAWFFAVCRVMLPVGDVSVNSLLASDILVPIHVTIFKQMPCCQQFALTLGQGSSFSLCQSALVATFQSQEIIR